METKKLIVELDEVKVVNIMLDLGDLESYKSSFLALKNHERNTKEILSVMGSNGTNIVEIVLLIDTDDDETKEVERCKEYAEQFGVITDCEVESAYILNKDFNGLGRRLDYKEIYLYE